MGIPTRYEDIIKRSVRLAAGAGVPGAVPGLEAVDVAAISSIWVGMTCAIAGRAGHPLSTPVATKFITSLLTGVLAYWGGSKVFTKLLHLIPGAGTITAIGINSFLNGFYTYRLGKSLVNQFDHAHFNEQDLLYSVKTCAKFIMHLDSIAELGETIACITGI